MNLDETRDEIQKVSHALAEGALRLQQHQMVKYTSTGIADDNITALAEAMDAAVREISVAELDSAMQVMDLLRIIATYLEPFAMGPGRGLTIAVAVLRMAADHAELGATMTTAEIIVGNITDFVSEVIAA